MIGYFFVRGKDGELVRSFIPEEDIQIKGDMIEFNPGIGVPGGHDLGRAYATEIKSLKNEVWEKMSEKYKKWGRFGKFGDWLYIRRGGDSVLGSYELVFIAREDYQKPVFASDMLPFFEDSYGQTLFAGVIKEDKNGERYKALIGGIRDVNGYDFESAMRAVVRESNEEAGILLIPHKSEDVDILCAPEANMAMFAIDMKAFSFSVPFTAVNLAGSYWTSEEEEHESTGTKRVHMTTAFTFLAKSEKKITPERLRDHLTPGDDAVDTFIWDIESGIPDFKSKNHRRIYEKVVASMR